jgi:putative protease
VGDFSLNVSNRLTAAEVLARGCDVFTPSFDLDGGQLRALLDGRLAPFAEVVVHHPMPLFHMEHCLIAAELSQGRDHLTCGRPCERHQVALVDRAGHEHPVEADVGCRNTVFHGAAQSGADLLPALQKHGVRRFRIELLREGAADVVRVVGAYRALIAGDNSPRETWRQLRTQPGYGVVRGSLRVLET